MTKRLLVMFCLVASLLMPLRVVADIDLVALTQARGFPVTAELAPKAYMVVNAENGQVLETNNSDTAHDPASLIKILAAYLVLEAIEQGKFTMDTPVIATENDQAIASIYALSNNNIVAGETYTVRELLSATMVASSNVATLMLAHLVTPDDVAFLQQMDAKAKELGLTVTTITNATGADAASFEGHYAPTGYDWSAPNTSTARDLALLTYKLLQRFPQIIDFTSSDQVTIKEGTPYQETLKTYNHNIPGQSIGVTGVNGLKTGSSPTAAYNTIVTAVRGDVKLIVVVLGASYWDDPNGAKVRDYFSHTLLEQSFTDYHRQAVAQKGKVTVGTQTVQTASTLYGLVKTNQPVGLEVVGERLVLSGSLDPVTAGVDLVAEKETTTTTTSTSATNPAATSITKQLSLEKILAFGNQYKLELALGAGTFILLMGLIQIGRYLTRPRKRRRRRTRRY